MKPSEDFKQKVFLDYKLGDKLGSGGFGCVYKALNQRNGEFQAIKILKIGKESHSLENLKKEVKLLLKLKHSNIVKYVDSFACDGHFLIVLE